MKKYFPLILILILGAILRFYHNLDISLWHDEAFSALMIRYPWGEMFYRLGLDVHPPMYYVFLRFWHYVFGNSLLSLRGFSILFSTGTIWAAWLFTKEAFKNEKAALGAALLVAINPFQLQYVTEARMYTFGAFFALLAGYFLVKALHTHTSTYRSEAQNMPNLPETDKYRWEMIWSYLGFTLSMIIIIYTHYYLFFTAAALGFYGLLYLFFHHRGDWKKYLPFLISCFLAVAAFLPWLKTFLFQYSQVQAGYWIQQMDRWSIPSTFWDMLIGFGRDTSNHTTQVWLVIITLFSLWMLYRFLKKTEDFAKWLVVFAVVAPFIGAILFAVLARLKGSSSSVYLDRYFLFASVYFSVAVAVWLKEVRPKWLSTALFVIYCLLNLIAYFHYWQQLNVKTRPGMAAAVELLRTNVKPADKLFVASNFMFFNFKYYWTGKEPLSSSFDVPPSAGQQIDGNTGYEFLNGVRPLLFTNGVTKSSNISHFAGSALLSDVDLVPDLGSAAHTGDTVWLLWTNAFGGSDKPPGQVPGNWIPLVGAQYTFPEVRPYPGTNVYVTEYKVN